MKFIYNPILLLLLAGVSLSSCKQELISSPEQYNKIYVPQAVDYPAVRNLIMTDTLQSVIFGAEFGGAGDQQNDINIHFKVDPALVNDFNTKNKTNYTLLPTDAYQLDASEVNIKAGTVNSNAIKIKIKTVGGMESSKEYILPVSIDQVSSEIPVNEELRTAYFLFKADYQDFVRTSWAIAQVSSQDIVQTGILVLDGNTTTMWHTAWRDGTVNPPHFISINMNKSNNMHGVYMWPDNRTTGAPKDIHIDVSTDGQNWNNAGDYTLPNTNERHTIYFSETKQAQYFKVTVKNTYGALAVTRLTEIGAF